MNSVELLTAIQAKFSGLQEISKAEGQVRGTELYLAVPAAQLPAVCLFLRSEAQLSFDFLSFVTSIDWKTHFEIVYYLVSTLHKHKLVLKVKVEDRAAPEVPSIATLYPTTDWQEREVFDMMGIRFAGHYNMRRILLPDDWEGYPLRKDYVQKPDRYD